MKKILPFLKANLVSVISVVVALLAAPVMLYFSGGWSKKIKSEVETEVANHIQQLNASEVTYQIEPYLSGMEAVSVKAPPNEASTNAVAALLQQVIAGSESVRASAVEFNSAGKALLIDGESPSERLFPENKNDSDRLRLLDLLIERYPKAHEDLLREFNAGSPPDVARMVSTLQDLRTKEVARLTTGRTEADLSDAQREQLNETLGNARLDLAKQAAQRVCFYATPSIFVSVTPWDKSKVLPMETAWEWQHTYWVHRDIIRALALANSDALGQWRPVSLGPVKVVESIAVSLPGAKAREASSEGGGGGGGPTDGAAEVARNFTLSHTGRAAAPVAPNAMYDIRFVDITMVVSASRLPQVIAAFPKVNFMTVVDVDLSELDPAPLLRAGYDLDSEHLVRATIRVETVWLRSWLKTSMPPSVRKSLGIPDDPAPAPNEQPAEMPASGNE